MRACPHSMQFVTARSGGAQLVDVAEELFDARPHLLALGAQRFHFFGELHVSFLCLAQIVSGGREVSQCGLLLLTQARNESDCFLDAIFQMPERVDFRFLSGGWHESSLANLQASG